MKTSLPLFCLIFILYSCKKENDTIATAEFTVSKERVYMVEEVKFRALDSTSDHPYTFDFGDGNIVSGTYARVHGYDAPGTYTAKMLAGGKSSSKTITVLPGILSYQIRNSSSRELNILSYVDNNASGSLFRGIYPAGRLGDTLYTAYHPIMGVLHLFGVSIFIDNKEYTLNNMINLEEKKHRVIEIGDSAQLVPRQWTGSPNPPVNYLIDL